MTAWKVGQKLICDRKGIEAYILEMNETHSGIYATLYHPKLGFSICCSIEMLVASGWKLSTRNLS
ncbi:hypothetical protein ACE1B6_18230 [Aerosakkonemataceae cyanobacterium BLCC-F154]|uniref:Uncharacterized protein n=1 Tax=Floridaenema fluviatile BLCC-F154 TaxID=3153640 RepID=A0ABV4YEU8_9CYAN